MQLNDYFRSMKNVFRFMLVICSILPFVANALEIDFTRHLSKYGNGAGQPISRNTSFFGVNGTARVIINNPNKTAITSVVLNGKSIAEPGIFSDSTITEIPVTLIENNTIEVTLNEEADSAISIRIKQLADIEMHVVSRMHFNENVSSFVAAREFFGKLGFETLMGFPDTNTQAMARAIGIETPTSYDGSKGENAGGYLLHGELIGMSGFSGGLIDLIEFTIPKDDEPPYKKMNHLGMASAALHTTNIAADYKYMSKSGVEFISAPATRSDGITFAIFSDLDGTHYKLIEVDGDDEETETTHVVSLGHVNVNVSDFDRSRAWYQMMGYEVSNKLASSDSIDVSRALGFEENFEINGAIVTHQVDSSTLELVQWLKPYDPEPPYSIPVNHLGIHRMAFATTDMAADVATLKAQGVEFVSPVTPCCSGPESPGSIVAFYDPDGTIVELVEQPYYMMKLLEIITWVMGLF